MKKDADFKLIQKNKKAYFNYEILEDLECGMALVGTEVKSVRDGALCNVAPTILKLMGIPQPAAMTAEPLI